MCLSFIFVESCTDTSQCRCQSRNTNREVFPTKLSTVFFCKKNPVTKFGGAVNLAGNLCGEKHWLSMCKLIDVSGDGPNGELERRADIETIRIATADPYAVGSMSSSDVHEGCVQSFFVQVSMFSV